MFNDKKLKNVSDAVSKVMEASVKEELKGDQHKIDANKNNKVDAHDFKLLRAGKKVAKEEVEQVEEGIEDKLEAARAKAKSAGKPVKGPAKAEKSNVTKVAGKAYGGSAQKDEPEEDEDDTPKKASKKGVFKRRYNTKVYKEQFSHLLDSYVNGGLKSVMEDLEVVEEDVVEEEVDNETFTKEVEAQKDKAEGKGKKADIAAASVQAVTKEDVEQIDELSVHKMMRYVDKNYKAHTDREDAHYAGKKYSEKENKAQQNRHDGFHRAARLVKKKTGKALHQIGPIDRVRYAVTKEDVDQVEERTLTSSEMETREKNVKGMKKNLVGFKERYGSRAKDVKKD
jgi:hypothetical protein